MTSSKTSFILPRHHHLFQSRSLQHRLTHYFVYLNCWLRSVEEAILVQEFQDKIERENADQVFGGLGILQRSTSSSTSSTYLPSDNVSNDNAMATTAPTADDKVSSIVSIDSHASDTSTSTHSTTNSMNPSHSSSTFSWYTISPM